MTMTKRSGGILRGAAAVLMSVVLGIESAAAADPVRIGVLSSTTGPFSDLGTRMNEGIRLYLKLHGDTVAGRKLELIFRDDTGPFPDVARRLVQELITRDKVELLTGFVGTPVALATIPLSTEAKKPTVLIQAATSGLTEKSPYVARVSFTVGRMAATIGNWAAKNGIGRVYTLVSDYAPGFDAEASFIRNFTEGGGKVIGSVRMPLTNVDYAVYLQRAKNEKPDAVFGFVPAGRAGIAFMKAFDDLALAKAGIRLVTTGDIVTDAALESIGDPALGVISAFHYSTAHESAENAAFLKAFREAYGDAQVDFMTLQGYDAMAAITAALARTGGDTDPDRIMAALSGLKLASARGPITINPQTRDLDQTVYFRRVEKRNGRLVNIEFDRIDPK